MKPEKFRHTVWEHYRTHGRHELPWRKTTNSYRILVSETMLQQTQVERVIPFYRAFLKKFPTVRALASAPLSDVLTAWQGLGYNRRARMLHQAAKEIVAKHGGRVPRDVAALESLSGIGPYTARAIAAFAHNDDVLFIETNIRTAVMHHFFFQKNVRASTTIYGSARVHDAEIFQILEKAFPKGRAREWYSALMDYGAHLKRSGVRLNGKAKGYTKQSTFKGSAREARGAILRTLTKGMASETALAALLGAERGEQVRTQLGKLVTEGLITKKGRTYRLAS